MCQKHTIDSEASGQSPHTPSDEGMFLSTLKNRLMKQDGLLGIALHASRNDGRFLTSISICMITKNEEKFLAGCLESVKDIADEIIIVDTGSTDKTKEIAKSMGAKVFNFKWVNNFSTARNVSLDKASGDWILVIDADETISRQDHDRIREAVSVQDDKIQGYILTQRTYLDESSSPAWQSSQGDKYEESRKFGGWVPTKLVRLFRNSKDIFYEGEVHETVRKSIETNDGAIKELDVNIHHYGKVRGEDYVKKKGELYLKLGEEKAKSMKGDSKAHFELGVQASRLGEYEKAVCAFEKALKLEPKKNRIYVNLGAVFLKKGEVKEAIKILEKGKKIEENADICNNLGVAYEAEKDYEKAIEEYVNALKIDPSSIEAHENMARIYFLTKQFDELVQALKNIIALNPKKISAYHNLGGVYLQMGEIKKAVEILERCLEIDKSGETLMCLGNAYASDKDIKKATACFERAIKEKPEIENLARQMIEKLCKKSAKNDNLC